MNYRYCAIAATVSFAAVLVGCGKSVDQKHEDIVQCGGFEGGLALYSMGMAGGISSMFVGTAQQGMSASTGAFATSMEQTLEKNNLSAMSPAIPADAVKQYAAVMDPAKVSRLEQDGLDRLKDYANKNDPDGAMAYYKTCISTFEELGR